MLIRKVGQYQYTEVMIYMNFKSSLNAMWRPQKLTKNCFDISQQPKVYCIIFWLNNLVHTDFTWSQVCSILIPGRRYYVDRLAHTVQFECRFKCALEIL